MINKRFIPFFCFLLSAFLLLGIISCSSPTETPKGSLTGTVNLEGLSDHSGITVVLYDLAYLDTTIIRINNQYPQIGVHINQHTEFDHRLQSSIKSTETLFDGSFELTKITTGTYNLVAQKENFGFKYLYEIEIAEGDNEISELTRTHPSVPSLKKEGKNELTSSVISTNVEKSNISHFTSPISRNDSGEYNRDSITLYEEVHISGNIADNIVVATDHHLIIDDDTVFVPNTSSLTIHPGAVIRINAGVDLTIHGTLTAQGEENNMFWITSNDGFTSSLLLTTYSPREELSLYNSLELSPFASVSDDLIEWGKWDYANTCLLNKVNNLHIQNGIFRNSDTGLRINNINYGHFSNLNLLSCPNSDNGGLLTEHQNTGIIEKNISLNNTVGLNIKDESYPILQYNYISESNFGILVSYASSPEIVHNNIYDCEQGIRIFTYYGGYPCDPVIQYNNIIAERCMYFGKYNVLNVQFNNLNAEIFAIQLYVGGTPSIWSINAINNYFYTTDNDEIEQLIFDKNDVEPAQQELTGTVYYNPFLLQYNNEAGIEE